MMTNGLKHNSQHTSTEWTLLKEWIKSTAAEFRITHAEEIKRWEEWGKEHPFIPYNPPVHKIIHRPAFNEDEFYLFMLTHKNSWVFGYRVFHYGKIYQSPETGETVYESQERLYPPVPWMQSTR